MENKDNPLHPVDLTGIRSCFGTIPDFLHYSGIL